MREEPSLRDHPGLVASVLTATMATSAYEIVPASTAPVVVARLGVSPVRVSWLVSVMLGVAVLASLPSGVVIDRFGARRSFVLAGVVFVAAGLASWYAAGRGSYRGLLLTRLVAGFGFVLLWNTGLRVFGRFGNRATATGLYAASAAVGFAVGHATGPLLAAWLDWRSVYVVYPLAQLVATVGVVAFWHDDLAGGGVGTLPTAGDLAAVARNPSVVLLCLLGFVAYSLYLFVNTWGPNYLVDQLSISPAESGALTAVFPLLGAVSRTSGGLVADRVFDGRARPVVVVSLAASGLALAGLLLSETYLLLAGSLVVGGYFVQLSLGLFYGVVPAAVADGHVTTAVALLTSAGLFGAFSAPILAGALIGATGSFVAAFGYALALTAVGIVAAVLYFDR